MRPTVAVAEVVAHQRFSVLGFEQVAGLLQPALEGVDLGRPDPAANRRPHSGRSVQVIARGRPSRAGSRGSSCPDGWPCRPPPAGAHSACSPMEQLSSMTKRKSTLAVCGRERLALHGRGVPELGHRGAAGDVLHAEERIAAVEVRRGEGDQHHHALVRAVDELRLQLEGAVAARAAGEHAGAAAEQRVGQGVRPVLQIRRPRLVVEGLEGRVAVPGVEGLGGDVRQPARIVDGRRAGPPRRR